AVRNVDDRALFHASHASACPPAPKPTTTHAINARSRRRTTTAVAQAATIVTRGIERGMSGTRSPAPDPARTATAGIAATTRTPCEQARMGAPEYHEGTKFTRRARIPLFQKEVRVLRVLFFVPA